MRQARGVSFAEIAGKTLSGRYLGVLENSSRADQGVFVLQIEGHSWVVPFVVEDGESIFLKAAYPSRRFHERYGGREDKGSEA